jgi:nucleoside-diphosphate-sugar epimerase
VSGAVLVTGGAGFVGSHVVDALLAQGERVRVLARATTDRSPLAGRDVEFVAGDVGDESAEGEAALARAAAGSGLVVHAAGITHAAAVADYARVNARGTERMARAAVAARVPRLVYISSQAAGGPSPDGRPRDEDDPDTPMSAYGRSKREGEQAARAALAGAGGATSLVVVRPPSVYGPRDRAFLELFRLVRRGIVPLHGAERQWVSLIHARDLAQAILAAAARGGADSTYYVTDGEPRTSAAVVDAIARALGCRPWRLDLPEGALRAVVGLAEGWAAWTGRPPRLTRERLLEWTEPRWTLSDARARRELGWSPQIPFEQGIGETAAWYRSAGWI